MGRGADEDIDDKAGGHRLVQSRDWTSETFIGFMHILLAAQQALSAYYFMTAFDFDPRSVGSGRPFCVLCIGNLLQLGAYMLAAALFVGDCVDINSQINVAQPNATEIEDEPSAVVTENEEEVEEAAKSLVSTDIEEGEDAELEEQEESD
jgi:hypothetical protein